VITADLEVYTADNGRQSVLKSDEEIARLIADLRSQKEAAEKRAAREEAFINRVFYEDRSDTLGRELERWETYQHELPTYRNKAKIESYILLIPDYDDYLTYQDKAKVKDEKGRPTNEINYSVLMAETLPKCMAVPDNTNEDGYRKLPPAEAKKVKPFIAEELWTRLYLGIHPSQSLLPRCGRREEAENK
jgi:hypothetical protein